MKIAVPTWVPEGFSVTQVDTETDATWGDSYQVRVTHPSGGEITMHGLTSGIGDVFRGESRETFSCPALGPGTIEFYGPDSEEGADFRTHWLVAGEDQPAYGISGRGLSPNEAVQVAASLTFIV